MTTPILLRTFDDGLVMRRATPADAERLSEFNSHIHTDYPGEPDAGIYAWTHDLLTKPHPTFQPGDFTIVEDPRTGKIVSSLNLISQTWSYGGIPFKVGRPELVGTLEEYRNRGLVRAQFEVIHQWSAERGELVQSITGIPYYYRIYGYEMGLNLGGGRSGYLTHVPELEAGAQEPYCLRPAVPADIPFIAAAYQAGCRRSLVSCLRSEAEWLYEIQGRSSANVDCWALRMIESAQGEPVGFIAHNQLRWNGAMPLNRYELKPGISWAAVTPSVIRYLKQTGLSIPAQHGPDPMVAFTFALGEAHPAYEVVPSRLPRLRPPYAWYMRVPDLPAFLRLVAPVLEQRLADSDLPGYTGELRITFYRSGLRLGFEQGKLVKAEPYQPTPNGQSGDAAFPSLTFLHLLFGHRSLDELKYAFADCFTANDEAAALLKALFPRQPSDVWPIA